MCGAKISFQEEPKFGDLIGLGKKNPQNINLLNILNVINFKVKVFIKQFLHIPKVI